jgi:hypothetical protein
MRRVDSSRRESARSQDQKEYEEITRIKIRERLLE